MSGTPEFKIEGSIYSLESERELERRAIHSENLLKELQEELFGILNGVIGTGSNTYTGKPNSLIVTDVRRLALLVKSLRRKEMLRDIPDTKYYAHQIKLTDAVADIERKVRSWDNAAFEERTRRGVRIYNDCEFFAASLTVGYLQKIYSLAAATPWLDWYLQTDRPEEIGKFLGQEDGTKNPAELVAILFKMVECLKGDHPHGRIAQARILEELPIKGNLYNVHWGVRVKDQCELETQVPDLLKLNGVNPWILAKPLRAALSFEVLPCPRGCGDRLEDGKPVYCGNDGCTHEQPGRVDWHLEGVDMVVVSTIPEDNEPRWIREIRRQTKQAHEPVKFYFCD